MTETRQSFWRPIRAILKLKWALVVGGAKGSFQNKLQLVISVTVSFALGAAAMIGLATLGQATSVASDMIIVILVGTAAGMALLSAATGVEASLDPRQLASEPLSAPQLGIGMLLSAVVGPSALLAFLSGVGIFLGWRSGQVLNDLMLLAVVLAWWATLILMSRATANMLGMWATGRFRQLAQAGAATAGLAGWFISHLISRYQDRWNAEGLRVLAKYARFSPPGQLGVAVGLDGTEAALALMLGVSWLPLLVWLSITSTRRLITVPPVITEGRSSRRNRRRRQAGVEIDPSLTAGAPDTAQLAGLWRALGFIVRIRPGPVGAIARRSVITKIRTPRQLVNTLTALIVGGGALLIGSLLDGTVEDQRTVLMGAMVQFAVLFDGNNSFGVDGSPIWSEVVTGADGHTLVRAKVLASLVTVAPFAVLLILALTVASGGWVWVPAALMLAVGALTSSAGVAAATSTYAPVAMPASANPLAAGDAGQGCVASITLAVGMVVLIAVAGPFLVGEYFVSSRSVILSTVIAAVAMAAGIGVMHLTVSFAGRFLDRREPALVEKVTPRR